MRTIRRLYFYAVAIISLEVVLWGLIGLLRSMVSSSIFRASDVLAQALALILVGVPIFLFHWLWSQRMSAKDAEEQTASLRAIFLYATLFATLAPIAQNLLALIDRIILDIAKIDPYRALLGGGQTWEENLIAIAVNGVVAFYFWQVVKDAWTNLPEEENFADVRRVYRYLWLLYSLLMVVFGTQQILRFIFYMPVPKYLLGGVGRETFANGLSLLLVGTPLWIYTWRIIQNSLSAPVEKDSNLRLGILYLLSLGGVITVLSAGGTLLDVILRWAFGEALDGYEIIQRLGSPISLGLPMAGIWAYYGGWLNRQIASDQDALRQAGKKRFYYYILSALGLAAAFTGVALVFSFIIDLLTSNAFWGGSLRPRLAGALAALAVGLPLWLQTWRPMQAEALADNEIGDHARRSNIRRVYLYLALFAGVIGGMVAAVGLVYQLVNALLSGHTDADFLPNLLNAAQMLALFTILLIYHLNCLRRDGAQAAKTLGTRQREFTVMLLDPGDETLLSALKKAMEKHAPDIPLLVQAAENEIESEAQAVILPASLAVNPPEALRKWLESFSGEKIVVAETVSGWVLSALTPEQAAKSARQLAEGEEIRLAQPSAAWEIIKTVAVVLLAIELLFTLLGLGISFIAG